MTRRLSIHKRLEHLATLSHKMAGAPIGPEVTRAICAYLKSHGDGCRSVGFEGPRNCVDLRPNPIGTTVSDDWG
jgi:hypothetical protein